jgi:hypothetical protein
VLLLRREAAAETTREPVLKPGPRASVQLRLLHFTRHRRRMFFTTRFRAAVASALHLSFPLSRKIKAPVPD